MSNLSLEVRGSLQWSLGGFKVMKSFPAVILTNIYYTLLVNPWMQEKRDTWIKNTHSICGETHWPGTYLSVRALLIQMSKENLGWLIRRTKNRDWFINQRSICQIPSRCHVLCWVWAEYTMNKAEMTGSPRKFILMREREKKMAGPIFFERWY